MKFGVHQFVWNEGRNQAELEEAMEGAASTGFDLLELPGLDPRAIDVARLVRHAEKLDLRLGASAGLRPECDLTSDDPDCVRRGEDFLNEAVALARDIGCTQLSGPIFSAHQKFTTLPTENGWRASTETLARVAERAKAAGVALCLELVNRYETNLINTVKQGVAYIEDSGSDNIFLHIDTFHMNIEEADQAQAIRFAGNHIGYVHVGENHRGILGTGTIDFAPVFDALLDIGYAKYVSVEAFDSDAIGDNLKAICAIWRSNWSGSAAFAQHTRTFLDLQLEEARKRAAAYQ